MWMYLGQVEVRKENGSEERWYIFIQSRNLGEQDTNGENMELLA